MSRRGAVLFALMSVLWGVPYLMIRVAVRHVPPATIVEGRTLVAAVLLVPLAVREGRLRPLLAAWRPVLAYTAVELGITWYLLSEAERRLPSSLTGLLVAAVPLISVVLAAATGHRDRMDGRGLLGLAVGLLGVGVLLGLDVGRGDAGALAEVAIVAVGYAGGPLIAARYLGQLSSLALSAVSLALIAVVYAPLAVLQHPSGVPPATGIVSVVGLGVVCTALAFVVFFELIKEVGSTRATIITYFNPAVALLLGVVVLDEPLHPTTGVGFVLIVAGSWLSTAPRRSPAAVPG